MKTSKKDTTIRKPEVASRGASRHARIAEAVRQCVATKRHGDTITRDELLGWFSIVYPQSGTKKEFDRINLLFAGMKSEFDAAMLEEHKMAVESEKFNRWRIVLPSEQAEFAARTARDAFRRGLDKSEKIARGTDLSQLTDAQRAKVDDTTARLAAIRMFANKSIPARLGRGEGAK